MALANVSRRLGGVGSQPAAVSAVQAFTTDLYRELATKPGNVVCSPYSVAVALAMTRNGARGQTAAEMARVLHAPDLQRLNEGLNSLTRLVESRAGQVQLPNRTTATISLDAANSLWGQRNRRWEPRFLEALARNYGAGMRLVDFLEQTEAARAAINQWTSVKTHDEIPEIIPPGVLDEMTRLVLVNAIYLKAPWEETFTKSQTKKGQFTRGDRSRVDVDMMSGNLHSAGLGKGPGWSAARLPYVGGKLAMTLVVPGTTLGDLERTLNPSALAAMLKAPKPVGVLELQLPRWNLRSSTELSDVLTALGMPTAFAQFAADFSGMTTEMELYITAALHQATVSVDEDGTEAAAATAVVIGEVVSAGPPPVRLVVDRPFLFVIHDVETATPLFIGRVDDPTAG